MASCHTAKRRRGHAADAPDKAPADPAAAKLATIRAILQQPWTSGTDMLHTVQVAAALCEGDDGAVATWLLETLEAGEKPAAVLAHALAFAAGLRGPFGPAYESAVAVVLAMGKVGLRRVLVALAMQPLVAGSVLGAHLMVEVVAAAAAPSPPGPGARCSSHATAARLGVGSTPQERLGALLPSHPELVLYALEAMARYNDTVHAAALRSVTWFLCAGTPAVVTAAVQCMHHAIQASPPEEVAGLVPAACRRMLQRELVAFALGGRVSGSTMSPATACLAAKVVVSCTSLLTDTQRAFHQDYVELLTACAGPRVPVPVRQALLWLVVTSAPRCSHAAGSPNLLQAFATRTMCSVVRTGGGPPAVAQALELPAVAAVLRLWSMDAQREGPPRLTRALVTAILGRAGTWGQGREVPPVTALRAWLLMVAVMDDVAAMPALMVQLAPRAVLVAYLKWTAHRLLPGSPWDASDQVAAACRKGLPMSRVTVTSLRANALRVLVLVLAQVPDMVAEVLAPWSARVVAVFGAAGGVCAAMRSDALEAAGLEPEDDPEDAAGAPDDSSPHWDALSAVWSIFQRPPVDRDGGSDVNPLRAALRDVLREADSAFPAMWASATGMHSRVADAAAEAMQRVVSAPPGTSPWCMLVGVYALNTADRGGPCACDDQACPVCLEPLEGAPGCGPVVVLPACVHRIHAPCLAASLCFSTAGRRDACCLCRAPVLRVLCARLLQGGVTM
jgi:hypothetical protein